MNEAERAMSAVFSTPGAALSIMRNVTDRLRGRLANGPAIPPRSEWAAIARDLLNEALPGRKARSSLERFCAGAGPIDAAVILTLAALAKTRAKTLAGFDSRRRRDSIARLEEAVKAVQGTLHPDGDAVLLDELRKLAPAIAAAGRQVSRTRRGPRTDDGSFLEWVAVLRSMGASKHDAEVILTNLATVATVEIHRD